MFPFVWTRWFGVAAGSLLGYACSSSDGGNSSGKDLAHSTAVQLPSTCAIPPEPAALGRALVVGDGTMASCTESALRDAAAIGGDISFDCGAEPVAIELSSTIEIAHDAILDGAGTVTLDGLGQSRIFSAAQGVHLALKGLTFTRGKATADDGPLSGGAVRGGWSGSLDIRDCVFTDNVAGTSGEEGGGAVYTPSRTTNTIVGCRFERNTAGTGGAVHNLLSGLTIIDSVFVDNESTKDGGGAVYTDGASAEIDDKEGGLIDICGTRFEGNTGRKQGGAAYLFAYSPDSVRVNQCLFENNQVLSVNGSGALGGALRVGNAQLDLGQSLFVGNHSDGHAGGLWVDGKYATFVSNCSFDNNDAGIPGSTEGGYGGAISGGNFRLQNLTLSNNWAVNSGGAIFNEDTTSELTNSILLGNRADNEWNIAQTCRKPLVGTHNVQWPQPGKDDACTEDVLVANPLLGELADNGGATQTRLPGAESPALSLGTDCPAIDQRGEKRATICDAGAVER